MNWTQLAELESRRLLDQDVFNPLGRISDEMQLPPMGEASSIPDMRWMLEISKRAPAVDIALGAVPGIGQAQSARDYSDIQSEREYAGDSMGPLSTGLSYGAQGLTTLGMMPFLGGVTKPLSKLMRQASRNIYGAQHFSKEPRETLDPNMWGQGLSGADNKRAESMRQMGMEVPNRSYFYAPRHEGEFTPEGGIGVQYHRGDLSKVYDPSIAPPEAKQRLASMADQIAQGTDWPNDPSVRATAMEQAIKDQGLSGMVNPNTGVIAYFEPSKVQHEGIIYDTGMQAGKRQPTFEGPRLESGEFSGIVKRPISDTVPTSVMNRRSAANRAQVNNVQSSVDNARSKFRLVDGWKRFEPKFNVDKKGKLQWSPDTSSGFDYHLGMDGTRLTGDALERQTDTMASSMVRDFEDVLSRVGTGDEKAQSIMNGLGWYRSVRDKVRENFGSSGSLYGDLQAATSPNTGLKENFGYADEAFKRFLNGEFDPAIDALNRHTANGGTLNTFDPRPYIRNEKGKLYGYHTDRVMASLVDQFRQIKPGVPPKVRNYGGNWTGSTNDPTIDVWAGRTAQRAAGRPRAIPSANKVEGVWASPNYGPKDALERFNKGEDVGLQKTGAYRAAEDAMKKALAQIKKKYPGQYDDVNADDFQAFEWLYEKDLWDRNGWGATAREANAIDMMNQDPRQLYRASISPTQDSAPTYAAQEAMQQGLMQGIDQPGILTTAQPTFGRYGNDLEQSVAHETSAPTGWNPQQLVTNVAREAQNANQIDAMISRRTSAPDPNARPGVEAYFDPERGRSLMPQIQEIMGRHGVMGDTQLQGPQRPIQQEMGPPKYIGDPVGIQSMFSPEITVRYGDEVAPGITVRQIKNSPELIKLLNKSQRKKYKKIAQEINELEGVQHVKQTEYDTLHFGQENYGRGMTPEVGPPTPDAVFGALSLEERLRRFLR